MLNGKCIAITHTTAQTSSRGRLTSSARDSEDDTATAASGISTRTASPNENKVTRIRSAGHTGRHCENTFHSEDEMGRRKASPRRHGDDDGGPASVDPDEPLVEGLASNDCLSRPTTDMPVARPLLFGAAREVAEDPLDGIRPLDGSGDAGILVGM